MNLSNEEFQTGNVSPKVLKHFIRMAPIANVPAFDAAIGTVIPEEYLTGLEYDGEQSKWDPLSLSTP